MCLFEIDEIDAVLGKATGDNTAMKSLVVTFQTQIDEVYLFLFAISFLFIFESCFKGIIKKWKNLGFGWDQFSRSSLRCRFESISEENLFKIAR